MAKRWLKEGLNFKCDVYTCEQTKRILISERWRRRKKTRLNFNVVREYLHDTAWNSFGNDRKLQKDHVTRSRVWISDAIEYDNTQIQLMVSAMKGIQRRLYSSSCLNCTAPSLAPAPAPTTLKSWLCAMNTNSICFSHSQSDCIYIEHYCTVNLLGRMASVDSRIGLRWDTWWMTTEPK